MKPLQIVALVVAGAMGGALVMKVAQRPSHPPIPAPAPVVAQMPAPVVAQMPAPVVAQTPAPVVAQMPAPAVAQTPAPVSKAAAPKPQAHPSPFAAKKAKPVRQPQTAGNPEPVAVAWNEPAPAPVAGLAAEPPQEAPTPQTPPVPVDAPPPARSEPDNVTPPPPPPPEPHKVTLNAGMLLPVRLVDGLSSERNAPGDAFIATLDKELVVDGFVIAERGARVEGRVVASDRAGKVRGVAGIAVELTRLHTADRQNVAIHTDSFKRHAEPDRGGDVEKVAVGAAIGAAVGAMAGGGKGAAIGAGVGGGAGAGDVMLTRGKPATLPSETRISFRLRAPVTLTERL